MNVQVKEKQIYETLTELSERTKLPKTWWYRQSMLKESGLPKIRAGKYLLFIPSEVDTWLRNQSEAYNDTSNNGQSGNRQGPGHPSLS
jgi:hypothetical protein